MRERNKEDVSHYSTCICNTIHIHSHLQTFGHSANVRKSNDSLTLN